MIVSSDRLKAWIHQPNLQDPVYRPPTAEEVLALLGVARVAVDDDVRARVQQFAALVAGAGDDAEGTPEIPEKYLIAQGRLPTEPEDGTFEWHEAYAPDNNAPSDEDSVDYFTLNTTSTVEPDVAIGRLRPPTEGTAGRDVFGHDVPPARRRGTAISVGSGLKVPDGGDEVVTATGGRVFFESGSLWLEELLDITGDVDFDTGAVDACVDVNIRGVVKSHFKVHTTKSLHVEKVIEAAEVDVDGDISVRGGICGHECQGHIRAGGSIRARFCNEAEVEAGGEFRFDREILNSHVQTKNHIVSVGGTIIGGDAWARAGIEVGTLGSEAGVLTHVAIGIHPDVLRRINAIDRESREFIKSAENIREKVQPLMANLKRLTAQQREAATELLAKADELEIAVDDLASERETLLREGTPPQPPSIVVHAIIHPGVRIAISGRETRIDRPIQGPVKIEERKVKGATEFVVVNESSGSVTVLPSTDIDLSTSKPGVAPDEGDDNGPDAG